MASVEPSTQQSLYGVPNANVVSAAMPAAHTMQSEKTRPRVSTTLWEDENTLCFQVEARGISVARREDNDMINGTKLLNVAGMTRGRRDGMLKAEKDRRVVKIGAMHLKGVWIPFDRALSFAQKEGIADLLFPLFIEDIRGYLYRQSNPTGAEIPLILPGEQKYQQSPGAVKASPAAVQQQPHRAQQQQAPSREKTAQQPQQQQAQYNHQYAGQGPTQAQSQSQGYLPNQYGGMQGYGQPMQQGYPPYQQQYSNYPQMMYPSQQQQQQQQQSQSARGTPQQAQAQAQPQQEYPQQMYAYGQQNYQYDYPGYYKKE